MKKFKNFLQIGAASIALASTMFIGANNSNANNGVNLDEIEAPSAAVKIDNAINLDNITVPGFETAVNLDTIDYPMSPTKLDLPEDKIEKVVIEADIPENVDLMEGLEAVKGNLTLADLDKMEIPNDIPAPVTPTKLDLPADEIEPVVIKLDKSSTLDKIKAIKKSQESDNTAKLKM